MKMNVYNLSQNIKIATVTYFLTIMNKSCVGSCIFSKKISLNYNTTILMIVFFVAPFRKGLLINVLGKTYWSLDKSIVPLCIKCDFF